MDRPAAAWNDIPVRDWLGRPVDCGACPHHALQAAGACRPGHSCMQDAYARRIDRFFRTHPALAGAHLGHPYFEVRAIAARHAEIVLLPGLVDDPDETVRLQVALRLPQRWLSRMRGDPHREVRIRVAQRLAEAELPAMRGDPDYQVRETVARRLPAALLHTMAGDTDAQVRREVARRLPMPALLRLADDPSDAVRRVVAERLPLALLRLLDGDDDVIVAHTVATRRAEEATHG